MYTDLDGLSKIKGVLQIGLTGDHIRVISEKGMTEDRLRTGAKQIGFQLDSISLGEPTLEDVFLSLAR
jgi:hypothetical protein